jgi:hypothetical protein
MSFYWYENDIELLNGEKDAMSQFFPQFQIGKLSNGKLYWVGSLSPGLYKINKPWYVQAVYQHNHPDNSSYAGSVRVYCIDPDLEEFTKNSGLYIPHTLRDEADSIYICTAGPEHIEAGPIVTSAAVSLSWAVKWIAAFELWVAGELATEDFKAHKI